jgi:hypothetical protein
MTPKVTDKVLNIRGVPEGCLRAARAAAALRAITLRQFVIDCLKRCARAEWEKVQQEMIREEEQRQKAQRLIESLSKLPAEKTAAEKPTAPTEISETKVVRCESCELVQFRTAGNVCRRCRTCTLVPWPGLDQKGVTVSAGQMFSKVQENRPVVQRSTS